jgi:hypothetical protein
VTFAATIAKSQKLDRALERALKEVGMAEIGGKKLVGEIGSIFDDVRKAVEQAKLGISGAASELMTEVRDLKHVETAIRAETASVREFKASVLGNAVGGENQETSEK